MLIEALLLMMAVFVYLALKHRLNRMFYRQLFEMECVFQEDLAFVPLTKGIFCALLPKVGATSGALFWYDEFQCELKIRTVKGISAEAIHPLIRFLKEPGGVLDQVIKDKTCCYLNDKSHRALSTHPQPVKAILALPLSSRGEIKGVLVIMKKTGYFSKAARKLVSEFSCRCGVHLENAQNHEKAVDSARENARLYLNISRLYQQATRDELTGLYNRSFTLQRLREEAKKSWRYGYDLSLIFMDIDYFKRINDNFGHVIGDQVLVEVARIVLEQIRDYDIACRFGGEEFVLILPQTGPDGALGLANRICQTLAEQRLCQEQISVTASLGVASILPGTSREMAQGQGEGWFQNCLDELVSRADAAMYVAKEKGRNRVELAPVIEPSSIQDIC